MRPAVSSEPPTSEFELKDEEEQTDPHLRVPTASTPPSAAPAPGPRPMAAMPRRTLGATGSIPTTTNFATRSRTATPMPPAPAPLPPPLPSSPLSSPPQELTAARPPLLPTATRFGPAPSAPPPAPLAAPVVQAAAQPESTSAIPPEPPNGPAVAAMLIPRPSAPPPALGRVSDPGAEPLRERIAKVEVHSAATRSIASRIEGDANRANARLDQLEPRLADAESSLRDALTAAEALEVRVAHVEVLPRSVAPAPSPTVIAAPAAPAVDATEIAGPLKTTLATIRQELGEHARRFEARRARIESFEARLGAVESDARLVELRRMTEGFDLRIARIERDHASAQADLDRKLASMLGEMEERLEGRLDAALKEAALREAALKEAAPKKPTESELRKIKGVGPKYQKALTELGITTIAAVAALSDPDLARIAAHLSMPVDKLKKLRWVETARALSGE